MQGIYKITTQDNGRLYIGQDTNIPRRWRDHKYYLKAHKHSNIHLQRTFDKYGLHNFVYEEILCGPFDKEELTDLEQFYIDKYKAEGKTLYNVLPANNSRLGIKHTKEAKEKISKSKKGNKCHLGFKHSEESKEKNRIAHVNTIPPSRKGTTQSKEAKSKISRSLQGNKNSLGCKPSTETREKLSLARKLYWSRRVKHAYVSCNES